MRQKAVKIAFYEKYNLLTCSELQNCKRQSGSCPRIAGSSPVYRSLPNRKRGRKPLDSNLFFYVLERAANACCTRDLHSSKQTPANTFSGGNGCPKPYLCPIFNCSQTIDTFFLHFPLCHNVLRRKTGAISKEGRDLRVAYSKPHAISRLYVPVICKYNGRTLHVNNVL